MGMLPGTLQLQIKVLAEELGRLFDEMSVAEDCYCVGSFSRILADQVVATAGHRPDRRYSTKLSVIFVDRTLDLFDVSSFDFKNSASLLFNNADELFPGSNDVKVDLKRLFNKHDQDFVVSGSISESRSVIPMSTLLTTDYTSLTDDVLCSLEGKLQIDSDVLESRDLAAILPDTDMYSKIENFLHFQVLAAVLDCSERRDRPLTEHLSSTDNSLLWTNLEDSVMVGQLSNSILKPFTEDPALNALHIATLLVHLYSLFGKIIDKFSDSEAIELAKLNDLFFKKVKLGQDRLSEHLNSLCLTDEELHKKIDSIFSRLESIAQTRSNFSYFRDIANNNGIPTYTSILEQVLDLCLDQDASLGADIEYRSGGLRDLLKTGLGLFTRSVAKPRPLCPVLVYIVGGVGVGDIRWVEEYRQRTGRDVILGGNCVLSHHKLAEMLFINDNVFGV